MTSCHFEASEITFSNKARFQQVPLVEMYCWCLARTRAVARMLIWGGGIFIYSCFAGHISFQIDQFEFDLKRNSSGRTLIYMNIPPPPPINVLATALARTRQLTDLEQIANHRAPSHTATS